MRPRNGDENRQHTVALINAFLASTTAAFGPIVAMPAATWSCKVEQAIMGRWEEVSPELVSGFFLATASFSNDLVAGQVTFGDREYSLDTIVGPASSTARYALWEWATVLDQSALAPQATDFVMTVERLNDLIATMANGIRVLQSSIAVGPLELIERMREARTRVREGFQAEQREDEHRRTCALASDAFRLRDFGRVVALLETVEGLLTPAEREKLAYARRRV